MEEGKEAAADPAEGDKDKEAGKPKSGGSGIGVIKVTVVGNRESSWILFTSKCRCIILHGQLVNNHH